MTDKFSEDQGLESYFSAARQQTPVASDALMARILADADAERAAPSMPDRAVFWRRALGVLGDAIGGWAGAGGLVAAAATGLWIGFAPPASLGDPVALVFGQAQTLSLWHDDLYAFDDTTEEG